MDNALAHGLLALCLEEQEGLARLQQDPLLFAELEATAGEGRRIPPGASFALIALPEFARRASAPDIVHRVLAVHADVGWHLEGVVLTHGWAGADLVGKAAAEAFSAMLAHADDRPALRLRAIDAALSADGRLRSDTEARQYGHIVDRTRVILQSPQMYGTYLLPTPAGIDLVWPAQDAAGLDARRERIGLPPLQHDIALYGAGATVGPFLAPVPPPT